MADCAYWLAQSRYARRGRLRRSAGLVTSGGPPIPYSVLDVTNP